MANLEEQFDQFKNPEVEEMTQEEFNASFGGMAIEIREEVESTFDDEELPNYEELVRLSEKNKPSPERVRELLEDLGLI